MVNQIAVADDAAIADLESELKDETLECDHKYADGTIREFHQIGLKLGARPGSPSTSFAPEDKKYLAETYASSLGSGTGYCIRFKTLKDINTDVLEAARAFGFENTNEKKGAPQLKGTIERKIAQLAS